MREPVIAIFVRLQGIDRWRFEGIADFGPEQADKIRAEVESENGEGSCFLVELPE